MARADRNTPQSKHKCSSCKNVFDYYDFNLSANGWLAIDGTRRSGIHRQCDQDQANGRRYYCTIVMPDGEVHEWILYQDREVKLKNGGVITTKRKFELPDGVKKWPTRAEFLKKGLKALGAIDLPDDADDKDDADDEENETPSVYKGVFFDSETDEELVLLRPEIEHEDRGLITPRGDKITDFGTTKINAPTNFNRDQKPCVLYALTPWPHCDWWWKIGIIQADRLLDRLRRDYQKNVPPWLRDEIVYRCMFYLHVLAVSAERHLIYELCKYGVQDGKRREYFIFAKEQAPHIAPLIERIMLFDVGAEFYTPPELEV